MKARVEHAVPLAPSLPFCERLVSPILRVTSSSRVLSSELPLSDMTLTKVLRDAGLDGKATPHGFRSSFKDWSAEVSKARDEVSEAALAHTIPDKVRVAYLRTRFLVLLCHKLRRERPFVFAPQHGRRDKMATSLPMSRRRRVGIELGT